MVFDKLGAIHTTFLAAKPGNAVLAMKVRQNNPDILLRRMQLALCTPDIFNNLLGSGLRRHGLLNQRQLG